MVKVDLQLKPELGMSKCAYVSSNTRQILITIMMMIIIQFNSFLINVLSRQLCGL